MNQKLQPAEKELLDSYENEDWKSVLTEDVRHDYQKAAKSTLQNRKPETVSRKP